MMVGDLSQVWLVEFAYEKDADGNLRPLSLTAIEVHSKNLLQLSADDMLSLAHPPYHVDDRCLFVSYLATDAMRCHLVLGWELPFHVYDPYVEYLQRTNGEREARARDIFTTLPSLGIDVAAALRKSDIRETSLDEIRQRDCRDDLAASQNLRTAMNLYAAITGMDPTLDISYAVLRGRFLRVVARMEHRGIPVDKHTISLLKLNWKGLIEELVQVIDAAFGFFEGVHFRSSLFAEWLSREGIVWPRDPMSGKLKLDDETFKTQSRIHTVLGPIRQLRKTLSQMSELKIEVDANRRSRPFHYPFGSKTGRNQPSSSKYIFFTPKWTRFLIRADPGNAVVMLDWEQQEFGIAAAFSGDIGMKEAYISGDPYLAFAQQAGAAPADATKDSHAEVRAQFKECALGVLYGLGADGLATRLGISRSYAKTLLNLHRETYPGFWTWSDSLVTLAYRDGFMRTVYDWQWKVRNAHTEARTIRNFPMQANGAEMMRVAAILMDEAGVHLCATVHDGFLVEASLAKVDEATEHARSAMEKASEIVLAGFKLRAEIRQFLSPERYECKEGRPIWESLSKSLGKSEHN